MLDPRHLRTFLAVEHARSFSAAARRLGLRQSTVSSHVAKLEAAIGRQVFDRDTHSVMLTADGAALVGFARTILDGQEQALRFFEDSPVGGVLRLGVSEDLVLHDLPLILAEFRRRHPRVELHLSVALSEDLRSRLDQGELDLVLGKRRAGQRHGELVFRDRLQFLGAPGTVLDPQAPVPLVVYPPPSLTRDRAVEVLEADGWGSRIAAVAEGINGLRAAALAGMGVVLHSAGLPPQGLEPVRPGARQLPDAGEIDFVLIARRSVLSEAEQALRSAILENAESLRAGSGR